MARMNDFRYDLRIEGADEKTLAAFAAAFHEKSERLIDYIAQDPNEPNLFSSQVLDYEYSGLYRDVIENELHDLAVMFPNLTLFFTAEDKDDYVNSYAVKFNGDLYQQANVASGMSEFSVLCPFEQRDEILIKEMERSSKVDDLMAKITKTTDFDLLYAEKQCLLKALEAGAPVPKEALQGLVNFLDTICDLGEALGRFQYDGIEPKFPLQPDYQKRKVVIEPDEEDGKTYLLCEEHEDDSNIREFNILAISSDEEGLKKLLAAKVARDDYGLIAKNGIDDSSDTHFKTEYEYEEGFVEYYILEQDVLTKDQVHALLQSPAYDSRFQAPEGLGDVLEDTLRKLSAEMGYDGLLDVNKASVFLMEDKLFQAKIKDEYWGPDYNIENTARANRVCMEYIEGKMSEDPRFFEKIGAMEKIQWPDNLKTMVIASIYNVCRDHNLPVQNADVKAEQFLYNPRFFKLLGHLNGTKHLEEGSILYQLVAGSCYDFAAEQMLPAKAPSLDSRIAEAKGRVGQQDKGTQKSKMDLEK